MNAEGLVSGKLSRHQAFTNAQLCLSMFEDMGRPIARESRILDFGCGEGWMVYAFRKLGYNAFGTDIEPPSLRVKELLCQEALAERGAAVLIDMDANDQRIPFSSDYFDVVVSWDVMEHVHDHVRTLTEIKRVLKPGGESLHYFPARYRPIESHTSVPFGTIIRFQAYLYFWALMGFKNGGDKALPAHQVATKNYEFLKHHTNYLTRRQIRRLAERCFGNVEFVEEHACKYDPEGQGKVQRLLCRLSSGMAKPLATSLLSACGRRAVFFVKPGNGNEGLSGCNAGAI